MWFEDIGLVSSSKTKVFVELINLFSSNTITVCNKIAFEY